MPLKIDTSKKTLVENFKTEKAHGRDEDQAWATSFETQRRAKRRRKKRKRKARKWDDHDEH